MPDWTQECHASGREWCDGGGSKSREFAAALDEIERLEKEVKVRDRMDDELVLVCRKMQDILKLE